MSTSATEFGRTDATSAPSSSPPLFLTLALYLLLTTVAAADRCRCSRIVSLNLSLSSILTVLYEIVVSVKQEAVSSTSVVSTQNSAIPTAMPTP